MGARSLQAVNQWIYAIGHADAVLQDMACAFTALILRGRQAHIMHIGDTRLYRLRDDCLALQTADHSLIGTSRSHILTRAIGVAAAVQIDYMIEELRVHDRYLLCSDGVHGVLTDRCVREILSQREALDKAAKELIDATLAARTSDNATARVIDVIGLSAANVPRQSESRAAAS